MLLFYIFILGEHNDMHCISACYAGEHSQGIPADSQHKSGNWSFVSAPGVSGDSPSDAV